MQKVLLNATMYSLAVALCVISLGRPSFADIEWTEKKKLILEASPIDVTTSPDGKWAIILTPGELLVYSMPEDKIVNRMTVDKSFDKISYSEADGTVIISSSSGKLIRFIQMDVVHKFELEGMPFKGAEKASVTVVVFSDYQCPYCVQLQPLLQQLLVKYPKDLKLVLRHFPLPMHPFARKAAAASLAANNQGKYWEFSQKLFEQSSNLNDARIQNIAAQLGLNLNKFNDDINSASIQALIEKDIRDASRASVEGTPSVFINGKALRNGGDNELIQTIERNLKRK